MLRLVSSNELDISCTLLPGRYTTPVEVPPLYNAAYAYWKKTWSDFFEKAGSPPGALNIENFMRHSFVITLHRGDTIAGMLLSSMFHLEAATTYDHPCIRPFPESVLGAMRRQGSGLCITGEYLSVSRDFRREVMGISLAEIMSGLLVRIFRELEIEMALAATVRSAKVDEICKKLGYQELGSYLKIGVDCIMLACSQQTSREHPDPEVARLVRQLWDQRRDETGLTLGAAEKQKKSAA
jgi:hypothetical protein